MNRQRLESYFNQLLRPEDFSDYCPNGIQIEGKDKIDKIGFAVSATKESIKLAISKKVDALVAHHGLFWNFHGSRCIKGSFGQRIIDLIKHDISLYAYHLPLDANLEVGNAKSLAEKINLKNLDSFGDHKGSPMGVQGNFDLELSIKELQNRLEHILQHPVIVAIPEKQKRIQSMGIITGGANSQWTFALKNGLDAYLTGEISEHDWHESQEAGVVYLAGGHYATEQFGIQALMTKVENELGIESLYIPSKNPA